VPIVQGQTGVRSFGVDSSGRICQDATGAVLCGAGGTPGSKALIAGCIVIQ
jgi:hypothetical protein